MQANIKLIRILKTFSTGDWKALEKLIASPWFFGKTDQERLLTLLIILRQKHPNYEQLTEATLVEAVFGGKVVGEGQLAKLFSKMVKAVERYLVQNKSDLDTQQELCLLAEAWHERSEHKWASQSLEKAERQFSDRTDRGLEYFHDGRMLAETWLQVQAAPSPALVTTYLQQQEQHLDAWYLLAKLEQAVWQRAQSIQAQTPKHVVLLPVGALESCIQTLDAEQYPVHALYRSAWHFLKYYPDAELKSFKELESSLKHTGALIDPAKRKALQTLLRIFATAQYNQGDATYLQLAFSRYQADLEAGDLYFNGKIHSQTLLNMVVLGLRSTAFSWVEKLLVDHREMIWEEDYSAQILGLNHALLAFYRGDTEQALDCLSDHYENLYYRLAARRLEIMIYYEQKSVLLEPKLEAFKVYVFRLSQKQIPEKRKALNNNFIDLLRQIIHPSTLGNEKRINRLKEKVIQTARLAEREWLGAKLQALT
ncbi:MAG: hypothetical protein AAFR36_25765 [Bacteroidota bacterium]